MSDSSTHAALRSEKSGKSGKLDIAYMPFYIRLSSFTFVKTVLHIHTGGEHNMIYYSRVPNKRDGWNKRDGGTFPSKSINMMFLINVMVGNFESFYTLFSKKNEHFITNVSM